MMRIFGTATSIALVSTSLLLFSPTASAVAPAAERGKLTPTAFALGGSGFGTRVVGGALPARSDSTAWQSLGCTNKAGKDNTNNIASATIPDLGEVSNAATRVWTTVNKKGVVTTRSRNSIAQVVLDDGAGGQLELNGLMSLSRAFHGAKGFQARTKTSVASIAHKPAVGPTEMLDIPTPGEPVEIPGVATITVGRHVERTDRERAYAEADSLRVDLALSGSRVKLAHSEAQVFKGVKSGLFNGRSAGFRGSGLDDNVSIGYQPLSLMPCQGTDGELRQKSIVSLDLGENINLRGVTSRQRSDQTRSMASGFERGRVDTVDVNDGALMIEKVVGKVTVTRTAKGLERTTDGTKFGEIWADGEQQEFPDSGVLEIPGVAKLERALVSKIRNGLMITALRVTLLDGSGAVLDLGHAKMVVKKSGR